MSLEPKQAIESCHRFDGVGDQGIGHHLEALGHQLGIRDNGILPVPQAFNERHLGPLDRYIKTLSPGLKCLPCLACEVLRLLGRVPEELEEAGGLGVDLSQSKPSRLAGPRSDIPSLPNSFRGIS